MIKNVSMHLHEELLKRIETECNLQFYTMSCEDGLLGFRGKHMHFSYLTLTVASVSKKA
jgi:hypothetical protein